MYPINHLWIKYSQRPTCCWLENNHLAILLSILSESCISCLSSLCRCAILKLLVYLQTCFSFIIWQRRISAFLASQQQHYRIVLGYEFIKLYSICFITWPLISTVNPFPFLKVLKYHIVLLCNDKRKDSRISFVPLLPHSVSFVCSLKISMCWVLSPGSVVT